MQHVNESRTFLSPLSIGLCALALMLACFFVPSTAAHGATAAEKQKEADAITQKIDELQTQLNQANSDYDASVAKHDAAVSAMDEAKKRIEESEKRIGELQVRLGERANDMYKAGGSTSFLDVILGATDFKDFLTAWDALEKISSQDAALVQETKDVRAEAQAAHEEYSEQEKVAAEEMQRSLELKTDIENKKASLQAEADKITAEVAELHAQEEAQAEAAKAAAAAASRADGGNYQEPNSGNVVSGNGQFTNPCPGGTLSSGFGYRSFDSSFHKGIDLAAPQGTPTYAAAAGTVMIAGYSSSAGNWVVISHGNGLVTKYMHHSALAVSAGQSVEKGQQIGYVGNTGNSFGAHLHFQVELNGTAVNPYNYL